MDQLLLPTIYKIIFQKTIFRKLSLFFFFLMFGSELMTIK